MNRIELIAITTVVLVVAFGLGWLANWLSQRLSKVTTADIAELDKMATALHEAEETRDQALTYAHNREAELTNQLSQTEAELKAAMDGLGDARREASELRVYIEENRPA